MTIRRCFRTLLLCLTLLTLLSGAALAGGETAPFAAVIQVPGLGEVEVSPQRCCDFPGKAPCSPEQGAPCRWKAACPSPCCRCWRKTAGSAA